MTTRQLQVHAAVRQKYAKIEINISNSNCFFFLNWNCNNNLIQSQFSPI